MEVTGPEATYELRVGRAAFVDAPGRPEVPPLGPLAAVVALWAALGFVYRLLWWRGRGMVVLRYRGRRWRWMTPSLRTARIAAGHLVRLVESGTWVPGRAPQPALPGADPFW